MVVRSVQKSLELSVCDRILIDVERFDVHGMLVKTARCDFPGISHVHADVVRSFDFYTAHFEEKVRFRNQDHARGSGATQTCSRDRHDLLFQDLTFVRKTDEPLRGPSLLVSK